MNNQETDRESVDEEVDERTQFELYYPPFEGAIAAGVGSVMCSYNKIRGKWSCENEATLLRDLKERLGFQGWVMSDWGATHSLSVNAGLDQEMPGSGHLSNEALVQAVIKGTINESRIDDGARRILTPFFSVGAFDWNNTNTQANNVSNPQHTSLARSLAASSIVLLKNNHNTLPLPTSPSSELRLVLFGKTAMKPVVAGCGSGQVVPSYLPSPYDAIASKLQIRTPPKVCDMESSNTSAKLCEMPRRMPSACNHLEQRCLSYDDGGSPHSIHALSTTVDVAIVFVSTSSCEGRDRESLAFDDAGDTLVDIVCLAGFKRVIVVAVAPGAVLMPWRDKVDAITIAFMPGQEYANALADILFGQVTQVSHYLEQCHCHVQPFRSGDSVSPFLAEARSLVNFHGPSDPVF